MTLPTRRAVDIAEKGHAAGWEMSNERRPMRYRRRIEQELDG
jgi:hypothetical protein